MGSLSQLDREDKMRKGLWSVAFAALLAASGCGNGAANVNEPDQGIDFDSFQQDDEQGQDDLATDTCVDTDKDGYFAGTGCREGLIQDCDNEDETIYPGAAEICDDGIDQDCSGADKVCPGPCEDADKDGYFSGTGCRDGLVQDCDDSLAAKHPGAEEICGDDIDQNCDGKDQNCPDPCVDADDDGYFGKTGTCASGNDCDDANRYAYPGANEVCEDGVDQDCDGNDDTCPEQCTDGDGDGYGSGPDCKGTDCNDANQNVHPGAAEICGNGIDEDCSNGDQSCPSTCVDEDLDGVGVGGACPIQDCNDDDNTISPLLAEVCGDGIDQNCDGADSPCVNCTDPDGDGYGVGTCDGTDCNQADPKVYQGAPEICDDGIDQDCNGEDLPCAGNCTDGDDDGYGTGTGCLGTDCNDSNASIHPGATEVCGNGKDEDCSGADLTCPPATCQDDYDCGDKALCDLSTHACRANVKVWEWWAPTMYVDTDEDQPALDFPVAVNFDGNWNASDNPQNIDAANKKAVVYYSFVKTSTHWYLGYYFYFPRRWSTWGALGTQFDNTLTGVLLVVEQDGSTYGKLVLMETFTEDTFFQYTPSDVALAGAASVDGTVRWDLTYPTDHHPIVYVHSEDHGVWGDAYTWNDISNWDENGFPGDSGVVYRYGNLSEAPAGLSDEVSYTLLENKGELWERRDEIGTTSLFDEFGHFNTGVYNYRSIAPWRLYDNNFPNAPEGEVLWNPADLVRRHFSTGWGLFSHRYVYNPYVRVVEILDMMVKATADAFGGAADPFITLTMCDGGGYYTPALNNASAYQNNWMKWDVEVYTLLDMATELGGRNFFYGLLHPDCSAFAIEIHDYDSVSGNEWLMDDEQTEYYDFSGEQLLDWGKSDATIKVTPSL